MNKQSVQSNWLDVKAKIKSKWGKFSELDLESFKDNLDKVSSQIQKSYGVAKDFADREFNEFKASLGSLKIAEKVGMEPVLQIVTSTESEMPQSEKKNPETKQESMMKAI